MPRMKLDLWKWAYGAGRLRRGVKVYLAGDMVEWKSKRLLRVRPNARGSNLPLGWLSVRSMSLLPMDTSCHKYECRSRHQDLMRLKVTAARYPCSWIRELYASLAVSKQLS